MRIQPAFADVADIRVQGRVTHLLGDILALLLCGTRAGGIPSEDTLARVLQCPFPKQ